MEFLRQLGIFNPYPHQDRRIDVIGVGATGSYVAWFLGKIGLKNVHLWDDDVIKDHNLPNQCFLLSQNNQPKVRAASELITQATGAHFHTHERQVTGEENFGEVVFLLTDSMLSRWQIWEKALKYKLAVRLMIETRLAADSGRIYAVNPCQPRQIKAWEAASRYSDEEAAVSPCGATIALAATATFIASLAVWQLIKWFKGLELENELLISACPWTIESRKFS